MTLKERIHNLPIIKQFVNFLKSIPLAKNAFSLYDLLELYTAGIIRGALTYRASAISYSFFLAIFPFLLFILNLIPIFLSKISKETFGLLLKICFPQVRTISFRIFFSISPIKNVAACCLRYFFFPFS